MRSVRTTFTILEAVAENQPIGLSEVARRLELPKSTVQRSLSTLADLGWIRSDGRDQTKWTLGDRARTLSDSVDDLGALRDAALPVLGQLNDETLETIHLAVPEADSVRMIERTDSKHALRLVRPIGTRSPMHASSTGKSVLAYLPQREVESYVERGLVSMTGHTIVDAERLLTDLRAVRERGYAIAHEELTEGIVSVAAPVRPDGGRPIAAVSISGPTTRMSEEVMGQYGKLVMAGVLEIASNLRK